jgi:hypothetical protein
VARSRGAFLTLLLGIIALAIAAQYSLMMLHGAAWLGRSALAQTQHAWHTAATKAAHVTHGAPHWGWASAQTGAPPLMAKKASWLAWPSWLGGRARVQAVPSWWSYSASAPREGMLSRVLSWRRPACAPPVTRARAREHAFAFASHRPSAC